MAKKKTDPEIKPLPGPEVKPRPDKTSPNIRPDLQPEKDPRPAQQPNEVPVRRADQVIVPDR